ncbi:MAG: hypothetical protein M1840_005848 [Geoglossum simile]|nr:MAG: hypothetical protein M1840_005848 [Geoglossum simile]
MANQGLYSFRDTGTCYQMWSTKFEPINYKLQYRTAQNGVRRYREVDTEYRMFWTEKKWEKTGAPGEVVPPFDCIPTSDEVVRLFVGSLLLGSPQLVYLSGWGLAGKL